MALPFLPGNLFTDPTVSFNRLTYSLVVFIGFTLTLQPRCSSEDYISSFLPQKTRFHRPQTLGWTNGYAVPVAPEIGIGGDPIPVNKLTQEELDELANIKPSLTYGQKIQAPPEDFIPAHVAFDKKVLLFFGYYKQTVHESADEYYRVRRVKIYYYLEDDAIAVIEPVVQNRY